MVIEAAASAVGHCEVRSEVVYDGVMGPWYLSTFLDASRLEGVHYAELLPPLAVCLQRVASREDHGFTDLDAAEHVGSDFHGSILGLEQHVLDAMAPPSELAQRIAERITEGTLRHERRRWRTCEHLAASAVPSSTRGGACERHHPSRAPGHPAR